MARVPIRARRHAAPDRPCIRFGPGEGDHLVRRTAVRLLLLHVGCEQLRTFRVEASLWTGRWHQIPDEARGRIIRALLPCGSRTGGCLLATAIPRVTQVARAAEVWTVYTRKEPS